MVSSCGRGFDSRQLHNLRSRKMGAEISFLFFFFFSFFIRTFASKCIPMIGINVICLGMSLIISTIETIILVGYSDVAITRCCGDPKILSFHSSCL